MNWIYDPVLGLSAAALFFLWFSWELLRLFDE